MLTPEQVVPFLQHDDLLVRRHALRYFRDSHEFGPLTADHLWAVIDRWGENDGTLGFATELNDLPQTEASLRRLIQAFASKPSEHFEFHYQHAARDMELSVLSANRQELLNCPQLLPHVREHLELRLNLMKTPADEAWDRLVQHGSELQNLCAGEFNASLKDALIEAAARGGAPLCERVLNTLKNGSISDSWSEIFAVCVLGRARFEPAVDWLVNGLGIDADIFREEIVRTLSRIGGLSVIDRIVAFYPDKPWHVRLYSHSSLGHIKRAESVDALLKLLAVELALEADRQYDDEGEPLIDALLLDFTDLCSLAGLDESRKLIDEFPDDPEALSLCECLVATAIMNGVTLPEENKWRKLLKARDRRVGSYESALGMFKEIRDRWRETGMNFARSEKTEETESPGADHASYDRLPAEPDFQAQRLEPIRNQAPKIGRNDPCPCGSGKKYKKCCEK